MRYQVSTAERLLSVLMSVCHCVKFAQDTWTVSYRVHRALLERHLVSTPNTGDRVWDPKLRSQGCFLMLQVLGTSGLQLRGPEGKQHPPSAGTLWVQRRK